jgi:hypothetical protein
MKVPKSWDEISIGQYIELKPVLDEEFDNPITELIHLLAVLLKQPLQEVGKLNVGEYIGIRKDLSFLWETELPRQVVDKFEIKGKWFKVVTNARELNGGQYMSLVTKLKDVNSDPNATINMMHEILTSISVPLEKGKLRWKEIEIEPAYYQETSKLFYNHLPMSVAYPIALFFYNLSSSLMKVIQDYSNKKLTEAEKIKEEVMMDFLKDGDGSLHSITSLMEIFRNGDTLSK